MRLTNKSHASLNKLVIDNEELSSNNGCYDVRRLYKLVAKRKLKTCVVIFAVLLVASQGTMLWVSLVSSARCLVQTNLDFYPKQAPQVSPMEGNQLLQLLSPRFVLPTIPQEIKEELGLSEKYVNFEKDSSQASRFIVSALGKSNDQAAKRARAYTDAAIALYSATRQRDLLQWEESTEARERELVEKFKALDTAELLLNKAHNVSSLQDEIEHISQLRSEKEIAYRAICLQVTKQSQNVQKMENQLGGLPTQLMEQAAIIFDFQQQVDDLTKNINELVKEGKGDSPEADALKTQLANVQASFKDFRDETERTTKLDLNGLKKLGSQFQQIKTAQETLKALEEKKEEAKITLEATDEYSASLHDLLPKYNDILAQRKELQQVQANCAELKSSIAYLSNAAPNELEANEAVGSRTKAGLINLQKAILCLILSALVTGIISSIMIRIEADNGNILSLKELTFQPGLAVIGRVGGANDKGERLYFRFKTAMGRRKTVFIGAMPGARRDADVKKEFVLQCALCGQKLLIIEFVNAKTFEPPEDANIFAAVSYKGDRGWMPLADMDCLSSSELLLLEADLKMLSSDFDIVMLIKKEEFTGKGVFAAQMTQLCDATMLLLGCNKTPRSYLRNYFREENSEIPPEGIGTFRRKPVMGVLTIDK